MNITDYYTVLRSRRARNIAEAWAFVLPPITSAAMLVWANCSRFHYLLQAAKAFRGMLTSDGHTAAFSFDWHTISKINTFRKISL